MKNIFNFKFIIGAVGALILGAAIFLVLSFVFYSLGGYFDSINTGIDFIDSFFTSLSNGFNSSSELAVLVMILLIIAVIAIVVIKNIKGD